MGGWATFRSDVVESVEVWVRIPLVAALAVVVAVAAPVAGLAGAGLSTVISLALVSTFGFYGTQRLLFARARAGAELRPGQLFAASMHYWARFAALGLIIGLLMFPAILIVGASAAASGASVSTTGILILCGATLVLDVLATFATPALVFTTPKAWSAFRIGRRLLAEHWSETKFHALLPPLIPLLVAQMISADNPVTGIVLCGFGAIVAVVARGAHTIAYLRYRQITPAALPTAIAGEYRTGSLWADEDDRRRELEHFRRQRDRSAELEPDLNKINEAFERLRRGDN